MTREQAYDLASEFFGLALPHYIADWVVPAIMEAVAIEREECAKTCEEFEIPSHVWGAHPEYVEGKRMMAHQLSNAIRARGER